MTEQDLVLKACEWNKKVIVDGIDKNVRDGQQYECGQFTENIRALRHVSNVLRIAENEGVEIASILDIPCGIGGITKFLQGLTTDVVAVDASVEAVTFAKSNSLTPEIFFDGDGFYPEKTVNRKFDLVFMCEFHPFKRDILGDKPESEYIKVYERVIAKYMSLLNDGGLFFVFHGINKGHHIMPWKLTLPYEINEVSPRIHAIYDLFRFPPLCRILDKSLSLVLRNNVTVFYIVKK